MAIRVLVPAELKSGEWKAPSGVEVTFYTPDDLGTGEETIDLLRGFDALVVPDFDAGDGDECLTSACNYAYDTGAADGLGLRVILVVKGDTFGYHRETAATLTEALTKFVSPVCLGIGFSQDSALAGFVRSRGFAVRVVTGDERMEELEAAVNSAAVLFSFRVSPSKPQQVINLSHMIGYAAGKGKRRVIYDPDKRTAYSTGIAATPAGVVVTDSVASALNSLSEVPPC